MYNIIVFIFLIGLFVFAFKFNKQVISSRLETAQKESFLKELASLLGIQHENIPVQNQSNTIANIHEKMTGIYRGIPLDLTVFMESQTTGSYRSFSYKMQNSLTFTVTNADKKKFTILPKEEGMDSGGSGNSEFDEKFYFDGDAILSAKFLQKCLEYGWMNLQLKGEKLVFNDNFLELALGKQMTGWNAQNLVHPIHKYSVQTNKTDVNAYKEFIDLIIDEIELAKLV